MAGLDKPKGVEVKVLETQTMSLKSGSGILEIGEALGIRKSALESLKNLGSLQIGDTFQLDRKSDETGSLRKIRAGKLLANYDLSKEAIYQNFEKGPDAFPYISFVRMSQSNEYQIVGQNYQEISRNPIVISATNLDAFRSELSKISGTFITECSARKQEIDLACEIKPANGAWHTSQAWEGIFNVNSRKWYDILGKQVDIAPAHRLIKNRAIVTHQELVMAIARSI